MHEIYINRTLINLPGEWDELTREQLKFVAGAGTMNLTETALKLNLLFYIGGVQVLHVNPFTLGDDPESLYAVKLKDGSQAYITASQLFEITTVFNFLFKKVYKDDILTGITLDSKLTRNVIYFFQLNGKRYYGPSSRLFNVTFSEFIHAETNCKRYLETRKQEYLDKLIAVLYRPSINRIKVLSNNYKGDRRSAFNDHKIDYLAQKYHKLDRNTRGAIFLFYQGCQWWYQQQFPHVFGKKSGGDDNSLGFLGLVDALTGGDVTKTEEIRRSYLMDVMVHLEKAAIDYEKMEEKLKKK